jgi:hypothetical protein
MRVLDSTGLHSGYKFEAAVYGNCLVIIFHSWFVR